ncbi:MAG: GDYXXLXY domain-containing protein [Coriobacteriales bacterium]|nr:GDYXXLXY domain-containing protein [Coriobacteriales bacterium]
MNDVMRRRVLFIVAIVIQLAIVMGLVITYEMTATSGKAVYLNIRPVDPRDPLRGDYMTFSYDISNLDVGLFLTPDKAEGKAVVPDVGSIVYVPLVRAGRVWMAQPGVVTRLPRSEERTGGYDAYVLPSGYEYSSNTIFIRGVIESKTTASAHVVYGIEEYFVGEGEGATYPTTGQPKATARVLVAPDGKAQLTRIFVDGKPWP